MFFGIAIGAALVIVGPPLAFAGFIWIIYVISWIRGEV